MPTGSVLIGTFIPDWCTYLISFWEIQHIEKKAVLVFDVPQKS